jgi:hypothetical protein
LTDSYSFAVTGDMADSSLGRIVLNRTNSSYTGWMQESAGSKKMIGSSANAS